MFNTSHQVLKILAAIIWFSGVFVLYIKGGSIFFKAEALNPDSILTSIFLIIAFVFGLIKAKFLFKPVCIKNLKRIEALTQPKLWEFYRFRFFIFLLSMVLLGSYLSHIAQGNYPLSITVLIIDISVGTALLFSSHCFWKKGI